jgi:hypothetical protein
VPNFLQMVEEMFSRCDKEEFELFVRNLGKYDFVEIEWFMDGTFSTLILW